MPVDGDELEILRRQRPRWVGYAVTVLLEAALTVGLAFLAEVFPLAKFPIPYVLLTMLIAYAFGEGPALLSIVLGWFAFTYMVVPPRVIHWPPIHSAEDSAAQVALLLGVILVAAATIQARKSNRRIQRLADESTRLNVSLRDEIAERKRAGEALQESEARYRTLFTSMGEGFALCEIILDEQGKPCDWRYLELNPAFERNTGLTVDRVAGRTVREVLPNIESYWIENYGRVALTGEPARFENYLQELNKYFEVFAFSPARGQFAVLFVDITDRKRAEEQLRESESTLRAVFDSVYDGILLHSVDGAVLDANERFFDMYQVSREEAPGLTIADLSSPSSPVEKLPQIWDGVMAGESQFFEWRARRPNDGSEFDVEVFLRRIRIHGRDSIMANIRDITDRKRAEEKIREFSAELEQRVAQRTSELEAANKELEAFSYSVSHDLRAPLRAIDGFSNALLKHYLDSLDPKGQDYLQRVRAAAQRMAQLIDDILGLSRATRAEMRLQRVDLSAMALEIIEELQKSQPERNAEIVVAEGLTVDGDTHLLRIALGNMLDNAWKFTSNRDVARIEVGAVEQDGERVYYVRDNGAGFNPAYADKLFSAFQRLHAETDFPGTGIGLALVQRILRRHGGRIWAESAVDQGATFYFTLGEASK